MAKQVLRMTTKQVEAVDGNRWITEASTIGIRAGERWPRVIAVRTRAVGEILFRFESSTVDHTGEGHVDYLSYAGAQGLTLTVWND